MLIYALLHLLGYAPMTIEEIKRFRQIGSLTPGHPENFVTPGVETTTGPLGQGLANAVGMAIAERHLAATFGNEVVDHRTYVLASDGDLMEGISQEAIALAGHLKLAKLIVLFDDNGISIDGPLSLADSVDQVKRFEAAGWAATRVDGHDPEAIARALQEAQTSARPSLIACRTTIGFGAPSKAGTEKCHGSPLGADEIKGAREKLGWSEPPFVIPADVLELWRSAGRAGTAAHKAWAGRLAALPAARRAEFERRMRGELPKDKLVAAVHAVKEKLAAAPKEIATRVASENALEALTVAVPEMVGGSADLTGSNNTRPKGMTALSAADYSGRFIHYGVREHAMAAAMNGMALHGGIIPYSGTFLVFSDYCRPAIRLAALDGPARHPRDDPRFDRARRGRPDPPAGRAPGGAARDPQSAGVPSLRRGGDVGMLAARAGAARRPERARAHPPEPAAAAARPRPEQPLRRRRLRDRAGGEDRRRLAVRDRIGGLDRGRGAQVPARARRVRARASRCPASSCSARGRRPTGARSSAPPGSMSRSRPPCARAGTRSSAPTASSSA